MPIVEMKNITKLYGELYANDNVSIALNKGEILAVVGENGAGKSTLMKILYGLELPTEGEIFINGEKQHFRSPHDAILKGVGMVQQHFMLIPSFTVAENIVYGSEPRKGPFFDRRKAAKITLELGERYGLDINPQLTTGDCPVGLQQRIEILKVLYQQVDIIIFDEPSAVLTPPEVVELLKTLRSLAEMGKSIILITHKLNEVVAVADRVVIMRKGRVVKEMPIGETNQQEMSYLMVGHQLKKNDVPAVQKGAPCLVTEGLTLLGEGAKRVLDNLNINVCRGEIVGIAGVSGNGQSELIQCLTGLSRSSSGKVCIDGRDMSNKSVEEIRSAGCACIPEDRYLWGGAAQASLTEVEMMAHHRRAPISKNGWLNTKEIKSFASKQFAAFDVKHTSLSQRFGELSGGNAQKLIIAREIMLKCPLLIAAEPTRGLDVGAIEYIHQRILDKRADKDAVLLISSELSEILALSDRIYVMYEGKIAGEFTREEATEEKLGVLMMGGRL